MIIVSGHMKIKPGMRRAFLEASLPAIEAARNASGCRDFIVAANPIEDSRVNVYEEWDSQKAMLTFRGAGPDSGLTELIVEPQVQRRRVRNSGTA